MTVYCRRFFLFRRWAGFRMWVVGAFLVRRRAGRQGGPAVDLAVQDRGARCLELFAGTSGGLLPYELRLRRQVRPRARMRGWRNDGPGRLRVWLGRADLGRPHSWKFCPGTVGVLLCLRRNLCCSAWTLCRLGPRWWPSWRRIVFWHTPPFLGIRLRRGRRTPAGGGIRWPLPRRGNTPGVWR